MKELYLEKATIENIEAVTDFVNETLEEIGFPFKAQMQIDVAIDELFGNIARYAYTTDCGWAKVGVKVSPDQSSVEISFTDEGKPFNPLEIAEPDTTLSADERQIGGLGIFLVRKTMDDMSYEYKDGKNCLTIRKNRE